MRGSPRMLAMGMALGLLATALGALPAVGQATPAGPATPEDAVRAYLQGVANADPDAVLDASAVDAMASGVDFVGWVDRLHAWMPFQAPVPATDPFLVELNRAQQASQLLSQTRMLLYGLLTDVELDGSPVAPVDAAWAQGLADQLDLARLAELEIGEIAPPDPELMSGERYLDLVAKQAAVYGADELTERVALIALDGRSYVVGFTLMRYDDAWLVSSQSSAIGGTPATGAPIPFEEWNR